MHCWFFAPFPFHFLCTHFLQLLFCFYSLCLSLSTGENIAVFIWKQMEEGLGDRSSLLFEVSLDETENNTFVYRGEKLNSNV